MPKLPGLFDSFDNLDQISPEDIALGLKPIPQANLLENYLGNRILYPGTLPLTEQDMKIDLSILREALKQTNPKPPHQKLNALLGDNPFLNTTLRKVLIPVRFLDFVPDLKSLVLTFIDALLLGRERQDFFEDLWTIVLTDDIDEVAGSLLLPQFDGSSGVMNLRLQGERYEINQGSFKIISCPKERCEIAYKLQKGRMLGKQESAVEIYGGKLGLVVDGRSV
ncbi:hypothetical protein HYU45_04945 [Candidatus Daviesbacteria bacterium]|nr:hypothetical protein [Candidatus Daviesbacteria bacterium]